MTRARKGTLDGDHSVRKRLRAPNKPPAKSIEQPPPDHESSIHNPEECIQNHTNQEKKNTKI